VGCPGGIGRNGVDESERRLLIHAHLSASPEHERTTGFHRLAPKGATRAGVDADESIHLAMVSQHRIRINLMHCGATR
jgi:hypothetical protein